MESPTASYGRCAPADQRHVCEAVLPPDLRVQKLENHEAAIAMFVAYYKFVWRTRNSDQSGNPGKLRPTAAMMAKVTDHLWSFDEFYQTVIQYA